MPISKFIPVAAIIGIVAALWTIIGMKSNLVLWVPFMSWALFFIAGAKYTRLHKMAIGLTGGTIYGVVLIWLLPAFNSILGDSWGLPALVFLAGTTIVLLEVTDWFELAPAYFFSFASFFAFWFGKFGGPTTGTTDLVFGPIMNFWILLMVGLGLGVATQFLREKILDFMKVPHEHRQTIFDKEKKTI